jgi:gliding motility-associated-like protein
MRKTTLCLLLIFFTCLSYAQNFKWAVKAGGTSEDAGKGIAVDPDGNIYIIGAFKGTTSFDSAGTAKTLTTTGGIDFFLVKYNCARVMQWRVKIGSTAEDILIWQYAGISIDPSGNIFVSSSFRGSCSFNSTSGSPIVLNCSSASFTDAFLAKYNNDGVVQWAHKIGSTAQDEGFNVFADAAGNVYAAGSFAGTTTFSTTSGTAPQLTSAGSTDIYVAKYNSAGVVQWVRKGGSPGEDLAVDLKVDQNGNLFVVGSVSCCGAYTVSFGSVATFTGKGVWDGFVAKCDSNGTWLWVNNVTGTGADGYGGIALDSLGNVYTAGSFQGTATASTTSGSSVTLNSSGGYDIFVCKYNTSGVLQWINKAGSSSNDNVQAITMGPGAKLYLLGNFIGTITFGTGASAPTLSSAGGQDICFAKYDSNGVLEWVQKAGGTGNDEAGDIVLDKTGDFIITGGFSSALSFGPYNLSSTGLTDMFIVKSATLSIISKNVGFCPNDSVLLSIDSLPDHTYRWKKDGSIITGATALEFWAATAGTYRILRTNTICNETDSATFVVTKKPLPIPRFIYSDTCANTAYFQDQSTVTTGGIVHRIWYFGDGDTSTYYGTPHPYDSAGTYTVKLVSTHVSGCKDSISKTITILPVPSVSFSFSDKCLDSSIAFNNQTTISSGSFKSFWQFGNGDTLTSQDPQYQYQDTGTFHVKLKATSTYGCRDSLAQSVKVFPKPSVAFSFTNKCLDSAVSFTDQSTIGNGSISLRNWFFGDSTSATTQNANRQYTYSGTKSVKLVAVSDKGCRDSVTKTVTVHPLPKVDFSFSNRCIDSAIAFTNATTINQGTFSSKWKFGNGDSSVSTDPSFLYASPGAYQVILMGKSDKGCKDSLVRTANVYPRPSPSFTFTNRCMDSAVAFADQSTVSSGVLSAWNWAFGDTTFASTKNASRLYVFPGGKTVKLTVITDKGCRDSVSNTVTVHPLPVPDFSFKESCMDSALSFTGFSSILSGTLIGMTWHFGDGSTATSSNPSHQYASPGSKSVKLSLLSDNGCRDSIDRTVNVHPVPVAGFTFSNRCQDSAVVFTDQSTVASGSIVANNWNFGDSLSSSHGSPSHSYGYPGTKAVMLEITTDKGCRDTSTHAVAIYPVPVPDFSFSSRCIDSAITFTNLSQIVSGSIVSLEWNFGDASSSASANPFHAYAAAGSYQVGLIASSNLNCRDTIFKTVQAHPLPLAEFAIKSICQDSNVTYTDQSSVNTPDNIAGWMWTFGDGDAANGKDQVHFYDSTGIYMVKLEVFTNHGCRDTVQHQAVVLPWLVGSFGSSDRCIDSTIQFTGKSAVSTGNNIVSRSWDFGDGNSSVAMNPSHQFLLPGTYIVTIRDSSSQGCVDTAVKGVKVHPIPLVDFTHSNPCTNTAISYSDISTAISDTIKAWNWDLGDGTSSSIKTPSHQYATSGNYIVRLIATSQYGCRDTAIKTTVLFTVPVTDFSVTGKCVDSALVFTDKSSISGDSIVAWNWTFGDGNTSSQRNITHTYAIPGNYQARLVVTSNRNCQDTIVKTATAHPLPVSNFSFTNRCLDSALNFADLTIVATGSVQGWSWDFGDGGNSSSRHPSHAFPAPGSYNVTLTGISDFGCRDTSLKTINVYPLPVADFTFANRCLDTAVAFTDNSSVSNGNIVAWKWDFGNGSVSSLRNPLHQYSQAGTYTITLIITTDRGCRDTSVKQLIIHPLPIANFTFVNRCQDTAISFTDLSQVSGGNIATFNWSLGDGNSSSLQHPLHKYNSSGTFNVLLTATTSFGCKDTSAKWITVFPRPAAQFIFTSRCLDSAINFNDLSVVASGNINSRNWNFGDGNSSVVTNPLHKYNQAGAYNVKLTVTSNRGCKDSSSMTASAHPRPSASFSVSDKCLDSAVTFYDNSTIVSGTIASGSWLFGDGIIALLQNPSHKYGLPGNYTVMLKLVSGHGCTDSASRVVRIHPLPIADFTFTNHCVDSAIEFNDISAIDTGSIVTWSWDFADGGTSSAQHPTHLFSVPGDRNVRLIVTSDKGCLSNNRRRKVTAFEQPVAGFLLNDICQDSAVIFTGNSTISSGSITEWKWDFGDGKYSGLQNPVHRFQAAGDYLVTLINGSDRGCRDTLHQSIIIHPLPVAGFNVNDGCRGEEIAFTDASTVSKGIISEWAWDLDESAASALKDPVFIYALHGAKKIRVVVTTDKGCRDTIEKNLLIFPKPDAIFASKEVCAGKPTPFTDQSTVVTGSIKNWSWKFGIDDSSRLQNPFFIFDSAGIYHTSLLITTDKGCRDTAVSQVKVIANPVISFSPAHDSGCAPLQVNFTDKSTVADGVINSWEWISSGNISSSPDPVFVYPVPGTYSISYKVSSSEGCVTQQTFVNRINVFPVPLANFAADPDSVSFLNPHIDFRDLSSGAVSWDWDFGDNSSSSDQHPSHTYADSGRYNVRQVVVSDKGCADTVYRKVFIAPDFTFHIPSSFSPNRDQLNDVFAPGGIFNGINKYEISIYNRWGQKIVTSHDLQSSWNGNYDNGERTCDIGVYMYLIKITDYFGRSHEFSGVIHLIR